jgi:uncharacterized repeat protein (TIGR01451 family)
MKALSFRSLVLLSLPLISAVLLGATILAFLVGGRTVFVVATQPQEAEAPSTTADLSITKTNNLTQVVQGNQVVYTLTLSNPTTETVSNALVIDTSSPSFFPQRISAVGANAIAQTVTFTSSQPIAFFATFGPGGFLNVIVTGTLSANATGLLTNTASISAPAGVIDPNLSNNAVTDSDPIVAPSNPTADLQISKTDGVTEVKTGHALSYIVVVTNAGPNAAAGVQITDVLPSGYQPFSASVNFRSATQRGLGLSAGGLLTATYDLLPGGVLTITLNGAVKPYASTSLTNTATVTSPATIADPDSANNVAVDVDTLIILPRTFLPFIQIP